MAGGESRVVEIYLPIAEVSISALLLLFLGAVAGVLAGMFGVGGVSCSRLC